MKRFENKRSNWRNPDENPDDDEEEKKAFRFRFARRFYFGIRFVFIAASIGFGIGNSLTFGKSSTLKEKCDKNIICFLRFLLERELCISNLRAMVKFRNRLSTVVLTIDLKKRFVFENEKNKNDKSLYLRKSNGEFSTFRLVDRKNNDFRCLKTTENWRKEKKTNVNRTEEKTYGETTNACRAIAQIMSRK